MAEEWVICSRDYRLRVSTNGRVFSTYSNRLLKGWVQSGYRHVYVGGSNVPVHTLVLEGFVGPKPVGLEARHLDGRRLNNRLTNLRWGTRLENIEDSVSHGTWPGITIDKKGESHPGAKLTDSKVRRIRHLHSKGKLGYKSLSALFGTTFQNIKAVVTRKSWTHI